MISVMRVASSIIKESLDKMKAKIFANKTHIVQINKVITTFLLFCELL